VTAAAQVVLPVARYAMSPGQQRVYLRAVNAEQRRCARRYGVRSTLPLEQQTTLMQDDAERRYGVVDAAQVRRYGYRPAPERASGPRWKPTPEEYVVMTGRLPRSARPALSRLSRRVPRGGCAAEGFRIVWDSPVAPSTDDLAQRVLDTSWELTQQDPRARAAAARWSACMARYGFHFAHRWDAGNSVRAASASVQRTMALRDLGCAIRANYVGTWYAVDRAYQRALIARHLPELQRAAAAIALLVHRARQVLARPAARARDGHRNGHRSEYRNAHPIRHRERRSG
jgi:hypothetical protein